jgi:hypothetical protein
MGARAVQIASQSFIDANGVPLNGGKLKFFDVGTSDARAVFTSSDKTGSTVTEVGLDTFGIPDTEVYYDGTLKIEVYNSADVKQYEFVDNTYYVDSFPSGTIVNATDYEDGSLDSSTINAAITDIGSNKRKLILKQGTWTIDANVTVPSNIELEFAAGATASISTGITLTINGPFIAPVMDIFTLNGTGAVTFGEGFVQKYHPEWFGFLATETGANNATYLQDCIDSITSGTIKLSGGTYSIDAEVDLKDKVNLEGDGIENTILDYSSSSGTFTNGACLYAAGSLGSALPSFSGNLSEGDHQITFSSDPSLSVGDVLIVYNSSDGSFNAVRNEYRAGEFVRVQQISGNTITLSKPLYDDYTAGATTSIYKITPTRNIIKNLQVKAKNAVYGIIVRYGLDGFIENVKTDNTNYTGLEFRQCFDMVLDGFKFHHYSTPSGNNYGLGISNSQKIIISNSSMASSRHGLSMGGGDYVGCVSNRDIQVVGSEINTLGTTGGGVLGFDMHGNAEHVLVDGNIINGGINFGGDKITITNNTIRQPNASNLMYAAECLGFNYKISNNNMFAIEAGPSSRGMIDFGGNGSCGTIKNDSNFVFSENKIHTEHTNHSDGLFYFYLFTRTASEKVNLDIVNNSIYAPNGSQASVNGIAVRNDTGVYLTSVNISGNTLNRSLISLTTVNAEFVNVNDNVIIRSGSHGIFYSDNGTPNFTTVFASFNNNKVYYSNGCGINLNGTASVDYVLEVKNNISINNAQTTTGSTDTDSSVYINTFDTVFFQNNVLGDNQSSATQSRVYSVRTITSLFEANNQNIDRDALTSINETSITYNLGSLVNRSLNSLAYGANAPGSGAWKQGDIVIDATPSAGGTLGWVCTTGGSPGTWKTFGAITA